MYVHNDPGRASRYINCIFHKHDRMKQRRTSYRKLTETGLCFFWRLLGTKRTCRSSPFWRLNWRNWSYVSARLSVPASSAPIQECQHLGVLFLLKQSTRSPVSASFLTAIHISSSISSQVKCSIHLTDFVALCRHFYAWVQMFETNQKHV